MSEFDLVNGDSELNIAGLGNFRPLLLKTGSRKLWFQATARFSVGHTHYFLFRPSLLRSDSDMAFYRVSTYNEALKLEKLMAVNVKRF
jgi:hypothetical protein